jgi:hypothetical protein
MVTQVIQWVAITLDARAHVNFQDTYLRYWFRDTRDVKIANPDRTGEFNITHLLKTRTKQTWFMSR